MQRLRRLEQVCGPRLVAFPANCLPHTLFQSLDEERARRIAAESSLEELKTVVSTKLAALEATIPQPSATALAPSSKPGVWVCWGFVSVILCPAVMVVVVASVSSTNIQHDEIQCKQA